MCGLRVTVDGDQVTDIRGNPDDVWSAGHICPKGAVLGQLHDDPDRLRLPMVKQPNGTHVAVSWGEAFAEAERVLRPVLDECIARDIAFVPFFPLGSAFHQVNPVLTHHLIRGAAERLGHTPAQIALAWTLGVADNVLLIPGTSSVGHLEENLAVADVELDKETQRELTAVA